MAAHEKGDPEDPGTKAVWALARIMDEYVSRCVARDERRGAKTAAKSLGLSPSALARYRSPKACPHGPTLFVLARIADRMPSRVRIAIGGSSQHPETLDQSYAHFFARMDPGQRKRLLALIAAWDAAGLLDVVLSISEATLDNLKPAPKPAPRRT